MPHQDPLYDTPTAAEYLSVSRRWLELARHRGDSPPYLRLAPRMIRYRRSDLDRWLGERMHRSTAEYSSDLHPAA